MKKPHRKTNHQKSHIFSLILKCKKTYKSFLHWLKQLLDSSCHNIVSFKKIAKTYSETIFLGPNQLKITISSSAEILAKSLVPNKYVLY